MPTHGCIVCPENLEGCCICRGHQHFDAQFRAVTVVMGPQCLKVIDVFDEPHRCLNRTNGFRAYCDVHMPYVSEKRSSFDAWDNRGFWLYVLMVVIAWCLGFWVRLHLL